MMVTPNKKPKPSYDPTFDTAAQGCENPAQGRMYFFTVKKLSHIKVCGNGCIGNT